MPLFCLGWKSLHGSGCEHVCTMLCRVCLCRTIAWQYNKYMQLYVKNVRQLHELALTLCLVRRSQNPAGEARQQKMGAAWITHFGQTSSGTERAWWLLRTWLCLKLMCPEIKSSGRFSSISLKISVYYKESYVFSHTQMSLETAWGQNFGPESLRLPSTRCSLETWWGKPHFQR